MCWVSRKLERKIAERDIEVYKVLIKQNKGYRALFQTSFVYKPDVKYSLNKLYYIERGDGQVFYIREGFHSYAEIDSVPNIYSAIYNNAVLCSCIIPKGSEYYVNYSKEVVSNQIVLKKIIRKL